MPETVITTGESAYINGTHTTDPIDASETFRVGRQGATWRRGLIRFSGLAAIPKGSIVNSAIMRLHQTGLDALPEPEQQGVHTLVDDWVAAEATWNNRATGVAWTDPGAEGDYEPVAGSLYQPMDPAGIGETPDPLDIDVTDLVQALVDEGENVANWLLKGIAEDTTGNITEYVSFGNEGAPTLTIVHAPAPVPNKPAGTIVLNEDADHFADLADAIVFGDGVGNTATALLGRDLAIAGTEDEDFEWLDALGGKAVRTLTTGSKLFWPAQIGSDATRVAGTILMVVKLPHLTEVAQSVDSGIIYVTGKNLAGALGVGQASIYLTDKFLHDEVLADSSDVGLEHRDSDNTYWTEDEEGLTPDVWIPVILTWDLEAGTPYLKFSVADPTRGVLNFTRSPAPDTGIIIRENHTEGFLMAGAGAAVPGQNVGHSLLSIAAAFRWTAGFSDEQIADALADPWFAVISQPVEARGSWGDTTVGIAFGGSTYMVGELL